MRVNRAVEKLRHFFSQRGVDLTSAALCGANSTHAMQVPPATLAAAVTTSVLQGSSLAT